LTVTFNFAGSQQLATQIAEGAPADVFASADRWQMDTAGGDVTGDPLVFAHNRLAIVVEPGNPMRITALPDLARDDVTVVLAAEQVPAGRYSRDLLARVGVMVSPVSLETDVRAVLTKVALGEADAGIVYTSDIVAAGDRVDGVAVPDDHGVIATYPMAVLDGAPNPDAGRLFVDAVRSAAGQASLGRHGFTAP
jgi:molybdate transport system substrate-binding protein